MILCLVILLLIISMLITIYKNNKDSYDFLKKYVKYEKAFFFLDIIIKIISFCLLGSITTLWFKILQLENGNLEYITLLFTSIGIYRIWSNDEKSEIIYYTWTEFNIEFLKQLTFFLGIKGEAILLSTEKFNEFLSLKTPLAINKSIEKYFNEMKDIKLKEIQIELQDQNSILNKFLIWLKDEKGNMDIFKIVICILGITVITYSTYTLIKWCYFYNKSDSIITDNVIKTNNSILHLEDKLTKTEQSISNINLTLNNHNKVHSELSENIKEVFNNYILFKGNIDRRTDLLFKKMSDLFSLEDKSKIISLILNNENLLNEVINEAVSKHYTSISQLNKIIENERKT